MKGFEGGVKPRSTLTVVVTGKDGKSREVAVRCRVDTPIEAEYYRHGGVLPYVLRKLRAQA